MTSEYGIIWKDLVIGADYMNIYRWIYIAVLILLLSGCQNGELEEIQLQAYNLYTEGRYEEAIEAYSHGIEHDEENSDLYTNRGMAYFEIGDYTKALEDLNLAIDLDDRSPEAYTNRGTVYLAFKEYELATADFYQAIALKELFDEDMGLYYTYLNLGTLLTQIEEHDQALEVYKLAKAIDDKDPSLHNAMGLMYRATGDYDMAIDSFNIALELDQDFGYAYGNRGSVYFLLEDYAIALADVETALAVDPYIPQFYDLKAKVLLELDRVGEAREVIELGLKRWSSYADLYINMGDLEMRLDNYSGALIQYGLAIQYEQIEGHLRQAVAFRKINSYEQALEALEIYLDTYPNSFTALMEQALNYQSLEDYKTSIDLFESIRLMAPDNNDVLYYMALSYEYDTQYEAAKNLLKEVIKNDPNYEDAIKELTFIEEHF